MKAKELTLKTITSNGYIVGKSIKGKGLEIFKPDVRVMSSKTNMYSVCIEDDTKRLLSLKEREDFKELYVLQYRHMEVWFNPCTFETQHISLENFIEEYLKSPESFRSFDINKKPQLIGYISLSKYKSDKDSQIQLCQDLMALNGISVYGEAFEDNWDMEYDDQIMKFTHHRDGNYWNGDYHLEHGNNWCEPKSDCSYFDGRMSNYNEMIMQDFTELDEGGFLKEIDPEDTISVYHRKGKDWYVGYSINSEEMYIYFKHEDFSYEKDDCEESIAYFYTYRENKELLDEVNNFLKSTKEDLEMKGFMENELDEDYDYRSCNVDFKVVELCFNDVDDLKELIYDKINWNYETIKNEFNKAYNQAVNARLKVDENLKVTVETFSRFSGNKYSTHNHLAILKRLENRYNYKLVQSAISENISTVSWAIKQENEEYHFNLASLIVYDLEGEQSLSEFISNALTALNKRRLEKLEEAELYAKASRVFVGIQDSLSSGNCQYGTSQFISKHNINTNAIGGIRGDMLLEMEKSNFTLRAVSYAIAAHHVA